jgi:hypothetical protein
MPLEGVQCWMLLLLLLLLEVVWICFFQGLNCRLLQRGRRCSSSQAQQQQQQPQQQQQQMTVMTKMKRGAYRQLMLLLTP